MVAGVVSTLGVEVLTPGEVGSAVAAEAMAAVVTSVAAAAILVAAVVTTASAEGAVTMALGVLAMAPVAADLATTVRNMSSEEGAVRVLAGAMVAMVVGEVTRAMALVPVEETASMSKVSPVVRLVQVLVETEITNAMEETKTGGAQGGVAPWSIGIGVRTWRVISEEALMPISCSKLSRRWWRL
jgi:hypothetical protein